MACSWRRWSDDLRNQKAFAQLAPTPGQALHFRILEANVVVIAAAQPQVPRPANNLGGVTEPGLRNGVRTLRKSDRRWFHQRKS
jgi:hypothetical protein